MRAPYFISRWFGNPISRKQAWYKKIRHRAKREGLHVYEHHMVWKDQEFFKAAKNSNSPKDGIPDTRCFVLQSIIRSIKHLEGDVAECGVKMGKSTYFMLTANLKDRTFCLFDSWEGLSKPTADDVLAVKNEAAWVQGDLRSDEKTAREGLAEFDNVEFYRGWIPDRFPEVKDRKFALLHVDVDLYEPTKESLDFFYPRLVPGGVIVCDDYGSDQCPGARKACDDLAEQKGLQLIELPTGQCLIFKVQN